MIFFEKTREKGLGQVLGILLRVAAAADVGVERKPVGTAQFLQRPVGLRGGTFARREHDRPMRRGKNVARRGRGRCGSFGGHAAPGMMDWHTVANFSGSSGEKPMRLKR